MVPGFFVPGTRTGPAAGSHIFPLRAAGPSRGPNPLAWGFPGNPDYVVHRASSKFKTYGQSVSKLESGCIKQFDVRPLDTCQ